MVSVVVGADSGCAWNSISRGREDSLRASQTARPQEELSPAELLCPL